MPAMMSVENPVSAFCLGQQILISAGVLMNQTATCYRSVAEELRGAGVSYHDADFMVDSNLVTSRQPSDLLAFLREIMKKIQTQGEKSQRVAVK
ncbi:MAG: DJ-1/PfpI family protein [Gammaproteobacteria bacterium]|nr:DJ-1/PfpI family protein [Gammaproteobacteria bacterium]MDH3406651.1 DJ-1/PfpI family protein [Gammaproteobacteria bacterium]MDH3563082.1 DJ-1/PfpI family protein [Gammaproteobacteria bacterium]MDH5487251.1 DJ-1/PfpI family protein [Gammaproteobacteria bacterium]